MNETSVKTMSKKRHCLSLFKFLLAALPTIVFGVFTIVFSLQQDAAVKATREQDQRQADETNRRIIFKEYIDDMKELLLDEHFAENMNRSLLQMRIQTLTVLRHLDPPRKYDLIRFLYENNLIRHDQPPTIDLSEADLSNMQFVETSSKRCSMDYLKLSGIYAVNITFVGCFLFNADFENAFMTGATFNSSYLSQSSFKNTDLTRAQFAESNLFGTIFTGATLRQSSFNNGILQSASLVNVDLFQSNIDDRLLCPIKYDGVVANEIFNTRYPNGSTSEIIMSNLIDEGEAELLCHSNVTHRWYDAIVGTHVQIIHSDQIPEKEKSKIYQRCLFQMNPRQTIIHIIPLSNYSVLVDLNQTMFNLSIWVGLVDGTQNDGMTIMIHFAEYENGFDYSTSFKRFIRSDESFRNHSFIHEIPPSTRSLFVSFVCNTMTDKNRFCVFDHVQLFIVQKGT